MRTLVAFWVGKQQHAVTNCGGTLRRSDFDYACLFGGCARGSCVPHTLLPGGTLPELSGWALTASESPPNRLTVNTSAMALRCTKGPPPPRGSVSREMVEATLTRDLDLESSLPP